MCYVEKFFKDKCLVNFFTNGKLVYRHWGHMDKENVYATVGVKFGPAHLIVQWPRPGDFKIDIVCLKWFLFLILDLNLWIIFIFTGQELSVHIAPHECLGEDQWTENSGLVKMNSFKRCYQLNALFKIKSGFIRSWRTNLNQNLFYNPHSTCINNYIAIYHVISY